MLTSAVITCVAFSIVQSAKILIVTPTPSISHQIVFRPVIEELINRNHEVVFFTPNPVFPQTESPNNLKEIDVHNISYSLWNKECSSISKGDKSDVLTSITNSFKALHTIFHNQFKDKAVLKLVRDNTVKFDLLILEECSTPALVFSHIFQAPVILISSLGEIRDNVNVLGGTNHPLLYPKYFQQKIYNLTIWEKIRTLFNNVAINQMFANVDSFTDRTLQTFLGINTPSLKELKSNIELLFLNIHPVWIHNQPLPSNVICNRGIHDMAQQMLPKDLQDYLDSSNNGVIYVSFGTNIKTSLMPPEVLKILLDVFSRLPYNVLWKYDQDQLPGKSENIKISKWFPQSALLRHHNLKLFITHGGLQSTDEAINSGVPVIGIPSFGDQHYNTEKYLYFKIGIKLLSKTLTIENFENAIKAILKDYDSYKRNIIHLRNVLQDQRIRSINSTIWWIEYVLRHGGAQHLRTPAANMPWTEYYELELVIIVLTGLTVLGALLMITVYSVYKYLSRTVTQRNKKLKLS